MTTSQIIHDVLLVLRKLAHKLYGEMVAQPQHVLHFANFANRAGEAPEVIAACLYCGYGHRCHELGDPETFHPALKPLDRIPAIC